MAQKMTITVPNSLAEEARAYDLPVSAICGAALRTAIAEAQGEEQRIVVRTEHGTEAFYGQWVVDPADDDSRTTLAEDPESGEIVWEAKTHWGVAVTRRGKVVVYQKEPGLLRIFPTLVDAVLPEDIRELAASGSAAPEHKASVTMHEDW